jgi:hypothetical protein
MICRLMQLAAKIVFFIDLNIVFLLNKTACILCYKEV